MDEIRSRWATVQYRDYALARTIRRNISSAEVREVVFAEAASIIERYVGFYGPSVLVGGQTLAGRPLHVVIGIGEETLWVITTYDPSVDTRQRFAPPDYRIRMGLATQGEQHGNLPDVPDGNNGVPGR